MTDTRRPADVLADLFPVDGPHSPELTRDAAEGVAALVRFLNRRRNGRRARPTRTCCTT
jgi:hypothetical protein